MPRRYNAPSKRRKRREEDELTKLRRVAHFPEDPVGAEAVVKYLTLRPYVLSFLLHVAQNILDEFEEPNTCVILESVNDRLSVRLKVDMDHEDAYDRLEAMEATFDSYIADMAAIIFDVDTRNKSRHSLYVLPEP